MDTFIVNDTTFGWPEVIAAAQHWGEWARFTERTRRLLACLAYAAATGQMPSPSELRAAATAFRYERRLISADEATAWLAARELTTNDWMQYLHGQWLAERWPARLNEILADHPITDAAVATVINKYARCSGLYEQWAKELAGRAAVAAQLGPFDADVSSPHELLIRIETAFAAQRDAALTAQRVQASIADHRLDWVRFDCRALWFAPEDEAAAREAAWCITEDGCTLDQVADHAHRTAQAQRFYLDELDAAVRPFFLAARAGDLLGPLKMATGFPLYTIAAKQMPTADDPLIRQRGEQTLLTSLMTQAINERVTWLT